MSVPPPRREPVFKIPAAIVILIGILVLIEFGRGFLGQADDFDLLARFAFVPIRLTALLAPDRVAAAVAGWVGAAEADPRQRAALAQFFLQGRTPVPVTLLSYALLHGGWVHVGLNSLWLLAFGTPVARRFGTARFLVFLAVTAMAGALTHWACFPLGAEPVVGASAAVSGCMGGAVRFAFRAPIRAARDDGVPPDAPPLSILDVFRDRRALSFMVVWFVSNAVFGVGSVDFGLSEAPVAWQAHVGGFLAGLLLFTLFDPRPGAGRRDGRGTASGDDGPPSGV